jgi:hypothetical protein
LNKLPRDALLVTQGDHGIDAHGAAGRDVAGGERNEGQQEATATKFIGNMERLVGRLE